MKDEAPAPWFPCWRIAFDAPVAAAKEVAVHLNQVVEEGAWCLLGGEAVGSERQLWAAWLAAMRNQKNERMRARSIEVEFIRLLAGTHHIDLAFKRAGVHDEERQAWLLHLPAQAEEIDLDSPLPKLDWRELENEAKRLAQSIQSTLLARRPCMELLTASMIGIDEDTVLEGDLLMHIASADDTV